jgi:5-(carboxyamino)imidazole ribonucleotide synthase
VQAENDLLEGMAALGCPAVLKTASFGYDGKGQHVVRTAGDAADAWQSLGRQPCVLEAFIDFDRELSVIGARAVDGEVATYEPVENRHVHHILDLTLAPADIDPGVRREALGITAAVLEALNVVGVLCVEFFLTRDGRLLINELAPRPHNSGHFTFDVAVTSQFEQQLRAVCGLPLGSTRQLAPAAMVNLLGNLWEHGAPDWQAAASFPDVKLHLYGKATARPGRKMGHLTAVGSSPSAAAGIALRARNQLMRRHHGVHAVGLSKPVAIEGGHPA